MFSLLAHYWQTPAQPLSRGHLRRSRGFPLNSITILGIINSQLLRHLLLSKSFKQPLQNLKGTLWRKDLKRPHASKQRRATPAFLIYIKPAPLKVSQAWSLHACWTRMLYNDRLETIDNSQSTNAAKQECWHSCRWVAQRSILLVQVRTNEI